MKAYTEHTHVSREELETEFRKIQKDGFAECVEEIEVGVSSVAAPVSVDTVGAIYSIGATGPIRRFTPRHRAELGKKLVALAGEVGNTIHVSNTV